MEGVDGDAHGCARTVPPGPMPVPGWKSPRGRRRTSGAAAPARAGRRVRRRTEPARRAGLRRAPRAAARSPPAASPPTTMTSSRVASVAASSMAARLSASARLAVASGRVRKPPRHRLDTRSPASAMSFAAAATPDLVDPVAPQSDRGEPGAGGARPPPRRGSTSWSSPCSRKARNGSAGRRHSMSCAESVDSR